MSVTYRDIFEFAKALADNDSEIDWRNCAARTYYAAYHRAKQSVNVCPDNSHLKMGDHERLTVRFQLHDAKAARSIAYVLQSMKRVRHTADYEIEDAFEKSLAVNQLNQFNSLVDRLNSFDHVHGTKTA